MKWILIGVICAIMIISNTNCVENEGLPLDIIPPDRTLPDHLNEINKDDNEHFGLFNHFGHFGHYDHFDHFGIGNDGLEPPLVTHIDDDDDFKDDVIENHKKDSVDEVETDVSNDKDNKKEETDISQIDNVKETDDKLDVRDDMIDDKKDEVSKIENIDDGKETETISQTEEKIENDNNEKVDDTTTTNNNDDDEDGTVFTSLKSEDYKFNPFISDDEEENKEDQFRAIFLARFLDPENLKILRERMKRAADDQAPTEVQKPTELKSIPLPDEDDDSAGRFLQT